MTGDRIQARAMAAGTFARLVFLNPFELTIGREFIFQNRFAIFFRARLQIAIPNFTKSAAFFARSMRRIEREQSWIEFFKRAAATGTAHLRAHDRETIPHVEQMGGATANLESALREITRFQDTLCIDDANDDIDGVFFETFEFLEVCNRNKGSIDIERVETLPFRPPGDIGMKTFARFDK